MPNPPDGQPKTVQVPTRKRHVFRVNLQINVMVQFDHDSTLEESWDDTCRLWTTDDDGGAYDQSVAMADEVLTSHVGSMVYVLFKDVRRGDRYSCFLDLGLDGSAHLAGGQLIFYRRKLTSDMHVDELPSG